MAKPVGARSTQPVKVGRSRVAGGQFGVVRATSGYGGRTSSSGRGGLADPNLAANAAGIGRSAPSTGTLNVGTTPTTTPTTPPPATKPPAAKPVTKPPVAKKPPVKKPVVKPVAKKKPPVKRPPVVSRRPKPIVSVKPKPKKKPSSTIQRGTR
jgi:hypothetical protein